MFKAVYAFLGDDEVTMRVRVGDLIDQAIAPEYRAFNLDRFSPGDASPAEIEEAARRYPLGEGRRVVLVRDLGGFSPADQELIAEAALRLAGIDDTAVTLAIMAPGLDRRRKTYRRLRELDEAPSGQCLMFEAPKKWQTDVWVRQRASGRSIDLTKEAADALVELIGDDLMQLDGELTKLALYAGDSTAITAETVEAVVGRRRGESPWDLPRRLFGGDVSGAQVLLNRLLDAGENPPFLVSVFTRYVLEAWQISLLLAGGASQQTVIREVGIREFAAREAIAAARRIPPAAFPRLVQALKACDAGLKSRSRQQKLLLERLLITLALEAGLMTGAGA